MSNIHPFKQTKSPITLGVHAGLTKTQARLLRFIKSYLGANDGVPPSFQEMMVGMGLHSKSGIYRLMRGLRERGHIGFIDNRARSIWIIARDDQ